MKKTAGILITILSLCHCTSDEDTSAVAAGRVCTTDSLDAETVEIFKTNDILCNKFCSGHAYNEMAQCYTAWQNGEANNYEYRVSSESPITVINKGSSVFVTNFSRETLKNIAIKDGGTTFTTIATLDPWTRRKVTHTVTGTLSYDIPTADNAIMTKFNTIKTKFYWAPNNFCADTDVAVAATCEGTNWWNGNPGPAMRAYYTFNHNMAHYMSTTAFENILKTNSSVQLDDADGGTKVNDYTAFSGRIFAWSTGTEGSPDLSWASSESWGGAYTLTDATGSVTFSTSAPYSYASDYDTTYDFKTLSGSDIVTRIQAINATLSIGVTRLGGGLGGGTTLGVDPFVAYFGGISSYWNQPVYDVRSGMNGPVAVWFHEFMHVMGLGHNTNVSAGMPGVEGTTHHGFREPSKDIKFFVEATMVDLYRTNSDNILFPPVTSIEGIECSHSLVGETCDQ